MSSPEPTLVQVTRKFKRPPEPVFDAWLDPARASKFLFATPNGRVVRTEIDPRVGGRFLITDRREGENVEHTGEFLEIERPRRLVFQFAVERYSATADQVTVEIAPTPAGCEVTLTHRLRPEHADFARKCREGWAMILQALTTALD